jgi:hypothetical protein
MEENIIKEGNECFICLEVSTKYEIQPSRLINKIHFFKRCHCDGWVHDECIEKWYYLKEKCPICGDNIFYINFDFHYMVHIIDFYFYIIKIIRKIIRNLMFFLKMYLFYMLTQYMFQIVLTATNKFNNYALENTYYINEEYIYYNYTCPQIL